MYNHLQSIQTQYRMNDRGDRPHGDTDSLARDIQEM